jgi:ribokinase
MTGHVLVVGSLNLDYVVRTLRHPEAGETVLGGDFHRFFGGKGANQAVAAARCGAAVKIVGCVGMDDAADETVANLEREGIAPTWIRRDARAHTGIALIVVDEQGQNTIVVAPGANDHVSPEDVSSAESLFVGAAVTLVQAEIPLQVVERAMILGRRHGTAVVLNPSPAQPLSASFLGQADTLILNQGELRLLTQEETPAEGVHRLRAWGVNNVVVTLGEDGALLDEAGVRTRLAAHKVQVVDTTAAGDAFTGAFAAALAQGIRMRDAAAWGNAAGALAVTRAGAQSSLPTRQEVLALVASQAA